MTRKNDILDHVRVAAPCHQSWEGMQGDEQMRHCSSCRLNVYNLSEMTREEATDLIRKTEGRLCVRYYRRTDGTIITKDCPVGVRAIRMRLAYAVSCAFVMFLSVYAYAANRGAFASGDEGTDINSSAWRAKQPVFVRKVLNWIHPLPVRVVVAPQATALVEMGDVISAKNYQNFTSKTYQETIVEQLKKTSKK